MAPARLAGTWTLGWLLPLRATTRRGDLPGDGYGQT